MDRKQAIKIIATNESKLISKEEREAIIYNIWGLDEQDDEFYMLSDDLRKELLNYEEPQEDITSSKYDLLVEISCTQSYAEFSNKDLARLVSDILQKKILVVGTDPILFECPCCGNKTLSTRGEYDICPICKWEDDGNEVDDAYSSVNHMTLKEGKNNYLLFGSCSYVKI